MHKLKLEWVAYNCTPFWLNKSWNPIDNLNHQNGINEVATWQTSE
jgi:hypothetical protein